MLGLDKGWKWNTKKSKLKMSLPVTLSTFTARTQTKRGDESDAGCSQSTIQENNLFPRIITTVINADEGNYQAECVVRGD
ncbi:jg19406 [Pararge aegeria aegeria]|uniref:Jg19406 protein n=1 Tax=Pararge aegeria aegeria TaxID=348720 RepID=A0A8S4RCD2_9NEOP|nr:jg19406 [Pararge aegeria aegeria]